MGDDRNEFNDLSMEAKTAAEETGVKVSLSEVLTYFNDMAERDPDAPSARVNSTPSETDDRQFGERLVAAVKEQMQEMTAAAQIKKMEEASKPHSQKVKRIATSRRKNGMDRT